MQAVVGTVRQDAWATALTTHVVDSDEELVAIRAEWDQLQGARSTPTRKPADGLGLRMLQVRDAAGGRQRYSHANSDG